LIGDDLSLIGVIIGVLTCPSTLTGTRPNGEGILLSTFLGDGLVDFQKQHFVLRANSFSAQQYTFGGLSLRLKRWENIEHLHPTMRRKDLSV
jgi:hypothetical protein